MADQQHQDPVEEQPDPEGNQSDDEVQLNHQPQPNNVEEEDDDEDEEEEEEDNDEKEVTALMQKMAESHAQQLEAVTNAYKEQMLQMQQSFEKQMSLWKNKDKEVF